MLRAVKNEVLEKLKLKRVSPERITESAKKTDDQTFSRQKKNQAVAGNQDESPQNQSNHLQILNMLENFERQSPHALNIFMENAKNKGIYSGLRGSVEFRKHTKSTFTKSIDLGFGNTDRRSNFSALAPLKLDRYNNEDDDSYPELPKRFSKLVTFKSASKNQSPNRSQNNSILRKSMNNMKDRIVFDSIKDISQKQKPFRLEKIETPAIFYPNRDFKAELGSMEFEGATATQNADDELQFNMKRTLPSIMKKSTDDSLAGKKQMQNMRYKTESGTIIDNSISFQDAEDKSKVKKNELETALVKKETVGGASFISPVPSDTVAIENIIQKRMQVLGKVPKLAPMVEKNDRFHDFFKKLCGTQPASTLHPPAQQQQPVPQLANVNEPGDKSNLTGQIQLNANLIKNLRLSKQNIKAHLSKRYGKVLAERLMQVFESCNKTLHNIEYNGYLDLIHYCFFSLQSVTIQGQVYLIPNMYKLLYQLYDGSNKGFFCEHDIFQVFWSINNGRQGVGPSTSTGQYGADMVQGLEVKSNGCGYQIDRSSYADQEFTTFSTNYRDSFPKIKRSVFIEAFQNDLSALNSELERLRLLQMQHASTNDGTTANVAASVSNGFKTRKKLTTKRVQQQQSIDHEDHKATTSTAASAMGQSQKIPTKPSSPEQRRLTMLQSKLKSIGGGNGVGFGAESKKNGGGFYGSIVDSIKKHTQEMFDMQNEDSKNKKSKQQANQMLDSGGRVINVSTNAFNHINPVKQIFQEKKNFSQQVQEILKQESCRVMSFEQLFRMSTFTQDIPQLLDDLFQHLTTMSLRDIVKKGGLLQQQSGLQRQSSFKKQGGRRDSLYGQQLRPMAINSANPFSQVSHEELNLLKQQLTFLQVMKHFDEVEMRCLMRSFGLLSQNSNSENNILNVYISQQSILDNFHKVFTIHNESLALRFYNLLSAGVNFNRIYLPTYLTRLHALFSNELADQMLFIFDLYDQDLNRQIAANDISDLLQNVITCATYKEGTQGVDQRATCSCRLFQEFDVMYKEYIRQNLMQFRVKKQLIDFEYFLRHIQYSCLIEEFQDKLLTFNDRPSIFSHEHAQIALLHRLHAYDRHNNYSQIANLNNQGYSNATEQAIKRTQIFLKKHLDFANNAMPSLKNINTEITPQNQQHILSQADEDFAGFMLAKHKAEIEIERITLIVPENMPNNQRMLKRSAMKLELGLVPPPQQTQSSITYSENKLNLLEEQSEDGTSTN